MRATAQDRDASAMMGINVDRTISFTFALGGALAGAAGVVYALYIGTSNFQLGFRLGLFAFTAAVLGGIGNLTGAVLGGVLLGMIAAYNDGFGDARWTTTIIFSILILILVFRPVRPARRADPGRPVMTRGAPGCGRRRARTWRQRTRTAQEVSSCRWRSSRCSSGTRTGSTWPGHQVRSRSTSLGLKLDIVFVIAVYVMLALGLNIVVGYAGLLDLGYVAFYALGAYTVGWFASDLLHGQRRLPLRVDAPSAHRRHPPELLARDPRSRARDRGERGRDHRLADAAPARRLPGDRHARLRRDHPRRLPQRRRAARARRGSASASAVHRLHAREPHQRRPRREARWTARASASAIARPPARARTASRAST